MNNGGSDNAQHTVKGIFNYNAIHALLIEHECKTCIVDVAGHGQNTCGRQYICITQDQHLLSLSLTMRGRRDSAFIQPGPCGKMGPSRGSTTRAISPGWIRIGALPVVDGDEVAGTMEDEAKALV